jgi:hypothetical protein
MTPEDLYLRLVTAFRQGTPRHKGAWGLDYLEFGRWKVSKMQNGVGRKVSFLFGFIGEKRHRYTLMDTVVAINGIDREVCEITWQPPDRVPSDEELVELMMLIS